MNDGSGREGRVQTRRPVDRELHEQLWDADPIRGGAARDRLVDIIISRQYAFRVL